MSTEGINRAIRKVSREDLVLIDKVITRYERLCPDKIARSLLLLALVDVHGNYGLNLKAMVSWPHSQDVTHDVAGIMRHWDADGSYFRDCFSPRFAKERA